MDGVEWKIFPGHTTLKLFEQSKTLWRKITFSQKISRIESSPCRCTTTSFGAGKAMTKFVNAIPQMLPNMPKSSQEDIGHSSDLDLKKNGMLRPPINQMVCGTGSPKKCCLNVQRTGILYSAEQVLFQRTSEKQKWWENIDNHNAEPHTAELLLRIIVSVNQLSVYGAVADWCQDLAQQIKVLSSPSTGTPFANVDNDPASQVPSHQITYLELWSPRKVAAATRREIRESSRRSPFNESL